MIIKYDRMGNIEINNGKNGATIKVGESVVLKTTEDSNDIIQFGDDIIQSGDGVIQTSRTNRYLSKSCVNGTCLIQTYDGMSIETKNPNITINGQKCIPCDVLKEASKTDKTMLLFYEKHCK